MPYLDTMLDPVTGGRIPAGAQRTELIGSKSTQTVVKEKIYVECRNIHVYMKICQVQIVEPTPIPKTTSMETTMDSNIGVAEIAVNTSSDDPLVPFLYTKFKKWPTNAKSLLNIDQNLNYYQGK